MAYGAAEKFGLMSGKWDLPAWKFTDLLLSNRLQPCGMFRKIDFNAIGGYDKNMRDGCEDWEFWIRLFHRGGKAIKLDNVIFFWRRKEVSRTTQIDHLKIKKLQQYIYTKHAVLYEQLFDDPITLYLRNKKMEGDWEYVNQHSFNFFLSRLKKKFLQKKRKSLNS